MMKKRGFEFRPSTLDERRKFYERDFDIVQVKKWFKDNELEFPQICALDAGSETGIINDKKLKGKMLYFKFSELGKKIKEYIPEDVYYERNFYKNPEKVLETLKFDDWLRQELVFDIDADNISCKHGRNVMVCKKCLGKAYDWTLKMKNLLRRKFNFRKLRIVYSGRGFHIHVLDRKAFLMSREERKALVENFSGFPIDLWVSEGNIGLVRMPYSLHGEVSRIVTPLSTKIFPQNKTHPKFLKKIN